MKCLGVELRLSTSFHPQTDGQTERSNRTLETVLRNFVNQRNNNWDEFLATTEIAINNAKQASTKFSPFFLNHGHHMKLPFLNHTQSKAIDSSTVPAAAAMFKSISQAIEQATENLKKAQDTQSLYANKKRRDEQFKVGEKVYLSTENLPIVTGVSKLNPKYIGPFEIIQIVNSVAVKLKLPPTMNIVNTFHVSKLKKVKSSESFTERSTLNQQEPVIVNRNDQSLNEWEVDEIIGKRVRNRRVEYLVHWKNYGVEEDSWEIVSNLRNATESVRQFERRQSERNRRENSSNTLRSRQVLYSARATTVQPKVKIKSVRILTPIIPLSINRRVERRLQWSTRVNKERRRRFRDKTLRTEQVSNTALSMSYVSECNRKQLTNANRSVDKGGHDYDCRRESKKEERAKGTTLSCVQSEIEGCEHYYNKEVPARIEQCAPNGDKCWIVVKKDRLKTKTD